MKQTRLLDKKYKKKIFQMPIWLPTEIGVLQVRVKLKQLYHKERDKKIIFSRNCKLMNSN